MIKGLNHSTPVVRENAGHADPAAGGLNKRISSNTQIDSRSSSDTAATRIEIARLAALDREVRAHERAHVAVAGKLVQGGGATFRYARGPDGRQYAISGEVGIDTSDMPGDPQATIDKAQKIRAAALAPANPSGQDRRVAAQATSMETDARVELARVEAQERAADETENTRGSEPASQAVKCAVCGGAHADSAHTDSNQRQIDATYVLVAGSD